jgi:hypothetical protein
MGEPFSVADGFVSVTVPALHDIRLLLDDLRNIKNAPYTVQRLRDDVRSVDLSLASLGEVKEQDLEVLGASVAEEAKTAIGSCAKACKQFRDDLQNWTWHSDDGTLRWQDRANVGFFKQAEIRAVSEQLQNCKLVITSVVSVATL